MVGGNVGLRVGIDGAIVGLNDRWFPTFKSKLPSVFNTGQLKKAEGTVPVKLFRSILNVFMRTKAL